MSMLDDLLAKLSKSNVSDMEIDKIVESAKKIAEGMGGNAVAQEALDKVMSAATDKKGNKDISVIENIKDGAELAGAVNTYIRRVEANPNNANRIKLFGLSERMSKMALGGVNVSEAANVMCRYLDGSAEPDKTVEDCANNVLGSYKNMAKYNLAPKEALQMLRNVDKLTYMTNGNHCENLTSVACRLDDEKVAETYLKLMEKHTKNQEYVLDTGEVARRCGEIVLHHPEMADRCMKLATTVLDKQPPFEHNYSARKKTIEMTKSFYDFVANDERVGEAVKAQARCKGKILEDKMTPKNILEGKRVILSPDKPPRVVDDKMVKDFKGRGGR